MKMQTREYNGIDEKVYSHTCSNGLEIFIIPKRGYSKKFATYTTKYGSMDDFFRVDGSEFMVPDGIAHFLEHKMFEKEDGDVFNLFSKHGANANAFTSYDRTSYLFSTTEDFIKNLDLLMNMVEQPYFTDETVAREVGIINEEIKMYQDNPGYRLYFETLNQMYHELPVKTDIAGTLESISEITKEHLFKCHSTFYHPSNMVMILVGDLDAEALISHIEDHQESRGITHIPSIERLLPAEPADIAMKHKVLEMDVQDTKVMIGFKKRQNLADASDRLLRDLSMMFALDMVFGEQSPYYYELMDAGLIDDSFSFSHIEEKSFAHTLLTSTTEEPEKLAERVSEIISEVSAGEFFTEEKLSNQKREVLGDYLSSLNSPEYIANQFTKYHLDGYDLYRLPEIIESITPDDARKHFIDVMDPDKMVECILKPHG
ncbi:EF-P 5-aminopentanol modification-associated protein YfmH [Salinicoccus carnicancri]|uniref:EF-P 5-aminopentanol modification-associated protein YfmH n=1 Tax=Salinicoccus carnicancri TaxID=558170 RepID=UPI001FE04BF1|nr:pitrilysin family protein [Salinicoccus carnicancri]